MTLRFFLKQSLIYVLTFISPSKMETHAPHVHHSTRKKFSNYFYEFLMLFLAVFCGFLAENIRETKVEHHREVQYIKSMIEDLNKDTANISKAVRRFEV